MYSLDSFGDHSERSIYPVWLPFRHFLLVYDRCDDVDFSFLVAIEILPLFRDDG